jgi:hypothetical protein
VARFWVGTSRAESGSSLVTFVWAPIPSTPGERRADEASRVMVTATTADGRQLYRGRVAGAATPAAPASTAPAASTAAAAPAASSGGTVSFEAPPGQVQLRLVVEGDRAQVIDSTVRELTVPDFTQVQVSIGTPRVYKARTLREMQALKTGTSAVPMVDREFSRAERLLIRAEAYAPGGVAPAMTARLLNRGGQAMADLPVQSTGNGSFAVELTLSQFASNDYVIELNAKTEAGAAQEFVAFRVGR